MGDWLAELNIPFDFTNIQGYPHDIPEKSIDNFPTFQGNNVLLEANHWRKFKNMANKFATNYEDVKMRLFTLSLEDDASIWFISLPANGISTLNQLKNAFMEKWGEKMENGYFWLPLVWPRKMRMRLWNNLIKYLLKLSKR